MGEAKYVVFPLFIVSSNHYLSVKLEDGAQHKNHRVFSTSTGEELIAFTQKSLDGWDLQYTISESHAVRLVSGEIQVVSNPFLLTLFQCTHGRSQFRPAEWTRGIVDKLKAEGASTVSLSPGLNPSVAVFVAEKKVRSYSFFLFFPPNILAVAFLRCPLASPSSPSFHYFRLLLVLSLLH